MSCTRNEEYCYIDNKCHGEDQKGDDLCPRDSDEDSEKETDEDQVTETTKNPDIAVNTTEATMKISTTTHFGNEDIFNTNDITTQETLVSTDHNGSDRKRKKITTLNIDLTTHIDYDNQTDWVFMLAHKDDDASSEGKSESDDISLLYSYKLLFVVVCTVAVLVIITCICCAVLYVMKKKEKWLQEKDNKVHVITDPKKKNSALYGGHMMIAPPFYEVNATECTYGLDNVDSLEAMFQQNLWNDDERLHKSNKQ